MRPRRLLAGFASCIAVMTALSCGDVPTLPDGVAYISGVVSPSLAVAAGDSLRDSLGNAAPLRVYAFGRNGDTLSGIPVRFLVTSLDTGIEIDETTGLLVASDSVRPVRIVGQAIGLLQTPEFTLQVVPQPDSLQPAAVNDSIKGDPAFAGLGVVSAPLNVTVSGVRKGTRVAVPYVVVRYEITRVVLRPEGEGQPDSVFALLDDNRRFNPRAPRVAVDTTDASGLASRRVRASIDAFDSVYVRVTARSFRGQLLEGSPATFTLVRGF
jgi:hypothetical protein